MRVIAPSSALPSWSAFRAGLAWLSGRYQLEITAEVYAREGYLAGSDAQRAEALQRALDAPEVAAIVAARGGFGATRLLERLDWRGARAHPKWLVGFSDLTALHVAQYAAGLQSVHGANITGLPLLSPRDKLRWLHALEGAQLAPWRGLRQLAGPRVAGVSGPLFGGNLALLQALAAEGQLGVLGDSALWLLEDVGEHPYRLDRMAISLRPYLRKAKAIVLGEFARCAPLADGVSAEQALRAALGELGVPLLACAPFGHGAQNQSFRYGAKAHIEADSAGFALHFD